VQRRERKIPREFENPIDDILLEWADKASGILRATNHTPNMITTYSFVSALAAMWALWTGHIGWFAGLWALQYFWDCVDGHYARKYNMTSKFGDLYDHITDLISGVGLALITVVKYRPSRGVYLWGAVLFLLMSVHTGCQQKMHSQNQAQGESLDAFKNMCKDPSWIRWTRMFGYGTMHFSAIALVVYLHFQKKK
jgi:phosphatidylglycerophosphate synthase